MNDQAASRARIAYSLICLVIALTLAVWFVTPAGGPNFAGDSMVNGGTWPRTMLLGIAFCAALLVLRNVFQHVRARSSAPAAAADGDEFDNRKAAIGIGLLIVYVALIPVIGFALATIGFFLAWLPYGGVRRPHVVVSVALIGTAVLLYTFVKLTTLPLDRGIGVFNHLTVSLYQLLGIY
jgi:hypothetical protein